jgi:hypothetical protein
MGGPLWREFVNKSKFLLSMCVRLALLHGSRHVLPGPWGNLYGSFSFVKWGGGNVDEVR